MSDSAGSRLRVLVVDDERPARDELSYLLGRHPAVGAIALAASADDALRLLQDTEVDVVFSDIAMPGLSGLELVQVLRRFKQPPKVVFVTAHDEHAVAAFDLEVVDYLLKPVRESRLDAAVRRVLASTSPPTPDDDEQIAVEIGGVTRFVPRSEVTYVEAQGDYTRLHTARGNPLVRIPLATLEQQWAAHGFVRIHRSTLVALAHVTELRNDGGRVSVLVDGEELVVARRHARELRDVLVGGSRPGGQPRTQP